MSYWNNLNVQADTCSPRNSTWDEIVPVTG